MAEAPAKALTAKEMKRYWRPRFRDELEKYYPTAVFQKYGFSAATCPKCGTLYWRRTEARDTCGDSACVGHYSFIGNPDVVKGENKRDHTMASVWKSFVASFTSTTPIAHTVVPRYPVVARWRDDCEFTGAGIQCYQPFCVTGEVAPPANPLIQPQFCLRFNDLDSIGLSGRHYSGFTMMGIQVFNTPSKRVFWKDETIDYNIQWLLSIGMDLDSVTFIADVWGGGGNLGPCIEYFIHGLEVGNMVFMQFKCNPDGSIVELPTQVVDVGIGLERVPWLLNGAVTSYISTFPSALRELTEMVGFDVAQLTGPSWTAFGKYSCLLNADECEDIDEVWAVVGKACGVDPERLKRDVEPARDLYIVLDHLRSLLVAIQDGALPSNLGGGSNLRNVLRRVFHVLHARGWWDACGLAGILRLMDAHRTDLESFHGPGAFPAFPPLAEVLEIEYRRWETTDKDARAKVDRLLRKKGGALDIDDWITVVTTFGLDADQVSEITGTPVPGDLYSKIAEQQERNQIKTAALQLYDTSAVPPTECLYYSTKGGEFLRELDGARVVHAFANIEDKAAGHNIVVLDRTIVYPTSGGQQNDTGRLTFRAGDRVEHYAVADACRVGPCVLHVLDRALSSNILADRTAYSVRVELDWARREQLMCHHTAAHVLHAAAHGTLGPHVWQAGAKKTVEGASLDITHYKGLTFAEERAIEREANRIVRRCVPIHKFQLEKDLAEKRYGFTLYQGGVVPGSTVRCVEICDTDVEACCGTHLDTTGQIGVIRIVKTNRISDGVVRIYYVAGDRALDHTEFEATVINQQCRLWGVDPEMIVKTADKFFTGWKALNTLSGNLNRELLSTRIQLSSAAGAAGRPGLQLYTVTDDSPTMYLSAVGEFAQKHGLLVDGQLSRSLVFAGASFVFAISSCADTLGAIEAACKEAAGDAVKVGAKTMPLQLGKGAKGAKGAAPAAAKQLMVTGLDKVMHAVLPRLETLAN